MLSIKHLICTVFLLGYSYAQTAAASRINEQTLVEVLNMLEEDYKVVFSYNSRDVKEITVQFERVAKEEFEVAINRALENTGLKYKSVGLNFYVIYKDNDINQRKLEEINIKIEEIRRMGQSDEFIISEQRSISNLRSATQRKILTGQILNEANEPLIGASIFLQDNSAGAHSDENGYFKLKVPTDINAITISYTGFYTQRLNIEGLEKVRVRLKDGLQLQGVTVIGSRGVARTRFDSPVPIDQFSTTELSNTGRFSIDEQLSQVVPSFNSGQHPVSDATAHFNPIDLRGLLPSRTLVLVNGKRKNASALLYSYVTASRGEVGVDLKSVGADAISGVEVLRDGAAAQYGSDAIAGVINLKLKERIKPFVKIGYSTTGLLDGTQLQASTGFSLDILKKGFASFTFGYYLQNRTQRAGTISNAADESAHWGNAIYSLEDFDEYLAANPKAGFQVGLPDMRTLNTSFNLGRNLGKNTDLYAFGTLMNRAGKSPQFARGPYWVTGFESIYPGQDYFLPEMSPQIADHMVTVGLKHRWKEWNLDVSSTYGNSQIDYYIKNSFNQSLGSESPKDFYNGAHRFRHFVNNLDINRTFNRGLRNQLTLAFGVEQRLESFRGFEGEFASYGDGTPDVLDRIGSESFSGLSPNDAVQGTRNNIGAYSELTYELNPKIELGGAARFESYSDFGENLSWKLNGLYKAIENILNIRLAVSNGFRAPSLHQIYFTSTTTTLTPEGVVQNRILNNLDPALGLLKIPKLTPETSLNISSGFTFKLTDKMRISFDAYQIRLRDRVVLSGQLGQQLEVNSPINQLLEYTNTSSAGFFLNAVNTTTQGIDLVFNVRKVKFGMGKLNGSLAANFNRTEVTDVNLPSFIEGNDLMGEVFSREDVSRLETWRPRQKVMFNLGYQLKNFSASLGVNYYGAVTYKHPNNVNNDATFGGKTITNCALGYKINSKIKWRLGINNLFNVYPDSFLETYNGTPEDRNLDFVGRFEYPWQTIQIGIDGIRGFTTLTYNL